MVRERRVSTNTDKYYVVVLRRCRDKQVTTQVTCLLISRWIIPLNAIDTYDMGISAQGGRARHVLCFGQSGRAQAQIVPRWSSPTPKSSSPTLAPLSGPPQWPPPSRVYCLRPVSLKPMASISAVGCAGQMLRLTKVSAVRPPKRPSGNAVS